MGRIDVIKYRQEHGSDIAVDDAMSTTYPEVMTEIIATGIYEDVDEYEQL